MQGNTEQKNFIFENFSHSGSVQRVCRAIRTLNLLVIKKGLDAFTNYSKRPPNKNEISVTFLEWLRR